MLARARAFLKRAGVPARTRIGIGYPADAIISEAKVRRYQLIVVGNEKNQGMLKNLGRSPVPLRLVKQSSYVCPVLIAKGKNGPIRRILLCDSGSSSPSTGLEIGRANASCTRRFASQFVDLFEDGEITILHVMSQISAGPGVRGGQLRATSEELMLERAPEGDLLAQDIEVLEQAHVHPRAVVRHGLVVDEILAEAREGDYDLVVIGAHAMRGWQPILLEDLAARIMERLDRPVLVLR
jgi:nucleotide-binding universal stress UspA family protein